MCSSDLILSEAAKLAESLGDTDRALSLWERRIDSDPNDLSGLDARIAATPQDDVATLNRLQSEKIALRKAFAQPPVLPP